jgi:hypothetical protein
MVVFYAITRQVRSYKMKYTYETVETPFGDTIIKRSDGSDIPADPANSDYQRYLRWLENPDADEAQSL